MGESLDNIQKLFHVFIGDKAIDDIKNNLSTSPLVTISGEVCTGKTQLAKKISEALNFEKYNLGHEFRRLAEEKGMPIEGFVLFLSKYPDMAIRYDVQTSYNAVRNMGCCNGKGMIAEGQLTGWYATLLKSLGKESVFRIYLHCNLDTRIGREIDRSHVSKEKATENLRREDLDMKRWENEFGLRVYDSTIYDLVIDTSYSSIEQEVRMGLDSIGRINNH